MMRQRAAAKGGFSLVEVCLAVLVVGLGIMSIFALFPTGLAASEAAQGDTEMGLYAEEVLFGLQAKATDLSWDEWVDGSSASFDVPDVKIGEVGANPEKTLAYLLEVATSPSRSPKIKEVILYVMPWRADQLPPAANMRSSGIRFYTELLYTELP